MLPKPVKNRKISSEQLNLTDSISLDDKIRRKRIYLYITLFITIGLSIIFWSYRYLKFFIQSPGVSLSRISFSLPNFNDSHTTIKLEQDLDNHIEQILSSTIGQFSLTIRLFPDGVDYQWSKNIVNLTSLDIDNFIAKLSNSPPSSGGYIQNYLPQGLTVKEYIQEIPGTYQLRSLVYLPQKAIFISIQINSSNLESSKKLLPDLISTIYWTIAESLPGI